MGQKAWAPDGLMGSAQPREGSGTFDGLGVPEARHSDIRNGQTGGIGEESVMVHGVSIGSDCQLWGRCEETGGPVTWVGSS